MDHTVLPATRPYPSRSWYSIKWPRRDERLSRPSWLVTYRDGIPAQRRSPIQLLTWPHKPGSSYSERTSNAANRSMPHSQPQRTGRRERQMGRLLLYALCYGCGQQNNWQTFSILLSGIQLTTHTTHSISWKLGLSQSHWKCCQQIWLAITVL